LFSKIGTTFGVGDGAATFNLPDLRGEFIRGFDDSRGIDIGRALGSYQVDKFKNHDHQYVYALPEIPYEGDGYGIAAGAAATHRNFTVSNTSVSTTGGNETRPRNIALLACIKYEA